MSCGMQFAYYSNGKYYYFSFEGALARDEIVDGYYLGVDGALDTTKGKSQLQDITMKTEKNVYPLNTEKIRVDITNNTNLESGYGGEYYLITIIFIHYKKIEH